MITVSTFELGERRYHHGGLYEAAIEAGMAMVEERGADTVGLREVARVVGVSATALYRHFPDKRALLMALSAEGLAQLGAVQAAAQALAGDDAREGFNATGRAYVKFALDHPGLFRLVFSARSDSGPIASSAGSDPMRLLQANAARLAGPDGALIAARAWSMVHGLALLILDGLLPADGPLIDRIVDADALVLPINRAAEES